MEYEILHRRALVAARKLFTTEIELLDLLTLIEACSGFLKLGFPSLHVYCVDGLGLSDDVAYRLIRVARKSQEVPDLRAAIASGNTTLSKAAVIAPVLSAANKDVWIDQASQLNKRKLERAVADANPAAPRNERAKEQGNGYVRLEVSVPIETHDLLERALELVAQKTAEKPSIADTLHFVLAQFIKREDPIEKADRNVSKFGPGAKTTASIRHAVNSRDRGACQFKMPNGKICGQRKWLHVHHVKPKSEGGTDEASNLTTLCSAHHRLVHEAHLH